AVEGIAACDKRRTLRVGRGLPLVLRDTPECRGTRGLQRGGMARELVAKQCGWQVWHCMPKTGQKLHAVIRQRLFAFAQLLVTGKDLIHEPGAVVGYARTVVEQMQRRGEPAIAHGQ